MKRWITAGITYCNTARELLSLLDECMADGDFNAIHAAAAFVHLRRIVETFDWRAQASPVFENLLQYTKKALRQNRVSARGVSNLLWAVQGIAPTAPRVRQLAPVLLKTIPDNADDMNAHEVATSIRALADIKQYRKEIERAMPFLTDRVRDLVADFEGRDITSILAAAGIFQGESSHLSANIGVMAKAAGPQLKEFSLPALISTMRSIAVLHERPRDLLQLARMLPGYINQKAPRLTAQEVGSLMWSIGTLRHDAPELQGLFPVLVDRAFISMPQASPGDVADMVWALGITNTHLDDEMLLLDALLNRASDTLKRFKPQALAFLCQGLALRKWLDKNFMALVEDHVSRTMSGWTATDEAFNAPALLWSYATLKVPCPKLVARCEDRLPMRVNKLGHWEVCSLAWSAGVLDGATEIGVSARDEARKRGFTEEIEQSAAGQWAWHERPPQRSSSKQAKRSRQKVEA